MKLGMVFECGPKGADLHVCEYIVKTYLAPRVSIEIELAASVPLERKPDLVRDCGAAAAALIEDGCDKVVIVWDLHPPDWGDAARRNDKPCRKRDCDNIAQALRQAQVDPEVVHLICITEELEAWLLADGRALSAFLSTAAHPVNIKDESKPEQVRNPKKVIGRHFAQCRGWKYEDHVHAVQIVRLIDLNRMRRTASFVRFVEKISDQSFDDILRAKPP